MHIQCTKKVLDFLNPIRTFQDTDDDFYAWHMDYIIIERRKLFVLMNDLTRYCVVFYGVKKSDFKDSLYLLNHVIQVTMVGQGYDHTLIKKYLDGIQTITYDKTKNRFLVARLNRAVLDTWWCCVSDLVLNSLEQPEISISLNSGPVGQNNWKIVHFPDQKMEEYLRLLA